MIEGPVTTAIRLYAWRVLLARALHQRRLDHASWIADQILAEVGK